MVVRRWVCGRPAAWDRREIQLRQHGELWAVRRIGQVWMPDEGHPTRESAMASIGALGPEWVEVEPYPPLTGRSAPTPSA